MNSLHVFRRATTSLVSRLPEATQLLTYRYFTYRHVWLPMVRRTRRR